MVLLISELAKIGAMIMKPILLNSGSHKGGCVCGHAWFVIIVYEFTYKIQVKNCIFFISIAISNWCRTTAHPWRKDSEIPCPESVICIPSDWACSEPAFGHKNSTQSPQEWPGNQAGNSKNAQE